MAATTGSLLFAMTSSYGDASSAISIRLALSSPPEVVPDVPGSDVERSVAATSAASDFDARIVASCTRGLRRRRRRQQPSPLVGVRHARAANNPGLGDQSIFFFVFVFFYRCCFFRLRRCLATKIPVTIVP